MDLGCLKDSLIASFVISLNTTRQFESSSTLSAYARCHAIASPSLSGSAAKYIFFAFFAAFFNSFSTSPLPRIVIYFGLYDSSTSTPIWLFGKSRTCPMDAITLYFYLNNAQSSSLLQAIQRLQDNLTFYFLPK